MKILSKLKLTQVSKADLEARQMTFLKGGGWCGGNDCGPCSNTPNPPCAYGPYATTKECNGD